jgi:prevent-host-death family protein
VKSVSVRDARAQLPALLNKVAAGEEVVILRRGQEAARLVPPAQPRRRLPDLTRFRASIRVKGGPLSATVAAGRSKERY